MRVDGKEIANNILDSLASKVAALKKRGITPTLAVIQVGDDPASTAYINQKKKAAERIGAVLIHEKLPADCTYQRVNLLLREYTANPKIHGIIVQQPLPNKLGDIIPLINQIDLKKDIDGFLPNSLYPVPVASAVITILEKTYQNALRFNPVSDRVKPFENWLRQSSIAVLGRGATAGKPIADLLVSRGYNVTVIHSQTKNPDVIIKSADIVISCVGKPNIVRRDNIKNNAILISVGIWRDKNGKLHGDNNESDIQDIAKAYTPTPGGVGPVNVACLMQNLVSAAKNS